MGNERIQDLKIKIGFEKNLLKHTRRLSRGLKLLRIFDPKGSIQITNRCLEPKSIADVMIKIPTLYGMRYVFGFTLDTLSCGLSSYSPDDLYCVLAGEKDTVKLFHPFDPVTIHKIVFDNKNLLLKEPIIDYLHVITKDEEFFEHDIIKYTRMWLSELYPEYGNKRIEYKDEMLES
jgi:hypothetical protein